MSWVRESGYAKKGERVRISVENWRYPGGEIFGFLISERNAIVLLDKAYQKIEGGMITSLRHVLDYSLSKKLLGKRIWSTWRNIKPKGTIHHITAAAPTSSCLGFRKS